MSKWLPLRSGLHVSAAASSGAAALIAIALASPESASAHGLIGRGDLPLPGWLLSWGAALLLIGSFAALAVAWTEPRLERDSWRPARLSAALVNPVSEAAAGVVGVGLLILVVYSGLEGVDAPDRNFSVTFVFVTFWLGLVVLSVFFGDVFRALNPWRAIARASSHGFGLITRRRPSARWEYPERWGRWPAVGGLLVFLWFELIWGQSGFAAAGVTPQDVAVAAIIYSLITFAGMAAFGIEAWTRKGETFSVYFAMFASLAPVEVRNRRLGWRRPLSGSTTWAGPAGSLALIIVAIGGTSFDGAQEGALAEPIASMFEWWTDAGLAPVTALRLTNSIFLAASLALVAAIFSIGIRGMRMVAPKTPARELAKDFTHVFIPIALAYLVAHYFSLVVLQEQAQFGYLLSDPLGTGADLLGTADSAIDYTAVGATAIQWVQFGSIVLGHALALALGHDRALARFGNNRDASWSQIWMLVAMLLFSTLGLYLLTQANA